MSVLNGGATRTRAVRRIAAIIEAHLDPGEEINFATVGAGNSGLRTLSIVAGSIAIASLLTFFLFNPQKTTDFSQTNPVAHWTLTFFAPAAIAALFLIAGAFVFLIRHYVVGFTNCRLLAVRFKGFLSLFSETPSVRVVDVAVYPLTNLPEIAVVTNRKGVVLRIRDGRFPVPVRFTINQYSLDLNPLAGIAIAKELLQRSSPGLPSIELPKEATIDSHPLSSKNLGSISRLILLVTGAAIENELAYARAVVDTIIGNETLPDGAKVQVMYVASENLSSSYVLGVASELGWDLENVTMTPFTDRDGRSGMCVKLFA